MRVKVAVLTLALSLPSFLWPPKPARAATTEFAPTMSEPRSLAMIEHASQPYFSRFGSCLSEVSLSTNSDIIANIRQLEDVGVRLIADNGSSETNEKTR